MSGPGAADRSEPGETVNDAGRLARLVPLASHGLYLAATGFSRGSSLILVIVLTRLLPVSEYGSFVLVVAVGEVLDSTCGSWIRTALVRDLSASARSGRLMGDAFLRLCVLAIAGLAVALAVAPVVAWMLDVEQHGMFALATAAYVVATGVAKFAVTLLQIRGENRRFALAEGVRSFLAVAAAIGAVASFPSFWSASLASSAATILVGLWVAVKELGGETAWRIPLSGYREDLRLGLPNIANAFLFYGASLFDRFMLQATLDSQAVALYAAAYTLGRQPIEVVGVAVNVQGFPALSHAYERSEAEASRALGACLSLLLLSAGLIIAMFAGVGQQAVSIVLPEAYREAAVQLIPIIMVGTLVINAMAFGFTNVLHVARKPVVLVLTTSLAVAVTLSLYLALIPRLGPLGAAAGYAGGGAFACVVTALVARRLLRYSLPWSRFVRIGLALCLAGAVASTTAGMTMGFGNLASFVAGGTAGVLMYLAGLWILRVDITSMAKALQ